MYQRWWKYYHVVNGVWNTVLTLEVNPCRKVHQLVLENNKKKHLAFRIDFTVKPGFHYPSSRPELTARELGCIFDSRVDDPSTRVHFLTSVNSGRQLGCQKMHPSSRAINSARELGECKPGLNDRINSQSIFASNHRIVIHTGLRASVTADALCNVTLHVTEFCTISL